MNLRIVYFGTPPFSATVLSFLLENKVPILAAVTKPDRPRGRSGKPAPSAVKVVAEQHGVPVFQPPKASDPAFADEILRPLHADLFVVVAYSEILKENLLTMPSRGCINVHASLLPKYRGAAPIQRCVMAGEKESGVTIMSMEKELDAGGILAVAKTPITDEMTAGMLSQTLADLGAKALFEVLSRCELGELQPVRQDASLASYAKKLSPDDGYIDWSGDCMALHNQARGVTPKPGAWCLVNVRGQIKRLLIKKTSPDPSLKGEPGALLDAPGFIIACGHGALELLEVQLEGKKSLSGEIFLRGMPKGEFHILIKK